MQPADRVVAQEEGGEGFLLHLTTGRYYSLNRTGMLVWRAIEQGADPVAAVRTRYPAAPEADVTRDVEAVIGALSAAELVAAGSSGPGAGTD